MKKIIALVLGIFLCFTLAGTAFADKTTEGFIHDQAGLLKAEEKQKLEKEAQDIYNKYKIKAQLLLLDVEKDKLVDKFKEYYGNSFTVESGVILTVNKKMDVSLTYYTGKGKSLLGKDSDKLFWGAFKSGKTWYDSSHNYLSSLAAKFSPQPRLVDKADLLSDEQEKNLLAKLDEISKRQKCDVVVVTVKSLEGKKAEAFADDYFDYNGYGQGENFDGILLLISTGSRDWHISTTGYGIKAFTDAGLNYMSRNFLPELKHNNYYEAFNIYADLSDKFLTQAKTDKPYDKGNLPKDPISIFWIPIVIGLGMFIARFIVKGMENQLETVRPALAANSYIKENSLNVTRSEDQFLYSTVNRTAKPKETSSSSDGGSSTHTSSSGRTHGGTGGKF